jgi:hypothetical protein
MAMRAPSAPGILRAAIAAGFLPRTAEVNRNGAARWDSRGLEHLAGVGKLPPLGELHWSVSVGDLKFASAMQEYGRMSIILRGVDGGVPWPAAINGSLMEFLQRGVAEAVDFVHDRADLCRLLASPEDVHRGRVYAWLPVGSFPARLVKALVLARDMQRADLEAEIREKLNAGLIVMSHGPDIDIRASAQQWAKSYSKALGMDIPL